MADAIWSSATTLSHPRPAGLTSAKLPPARVNLTDLVEFCGARLPQLNARPGSADTRLAAKSPERFALWPSGPASR